jgi:hypothetical protein
MPTIIRHKNTLHGFAVVVTEFNNPAFGFTCQFQLYRDHHHGKLTLEDQQTFSTERDAIEVFDKQLTGGQ